MSTNACPKCGNKTLVFEIFCSHHYPKVDVENSTPDVQKTYWVQDIHVVVSCEMCKWEIEHKEEWE